MKQSIIILIVAVLIGVGFFAWRASTTDPLATKTPKELIDDLLTLTIETNKDTLELFVEVADNAPTRSQGLQYRTQLSTRSGMLFVFEAESTKNFWMKNTLMPLDILWIDQSKNIVGHDTMVPCKPENNNDPCPITSSPPNTFYALEVYDQFVEDNEIEMGNKLRFTLE